MKSTPMVIKKRVQPKHQRSQGEERRPSLLSSLERKEWCKHLITHPYYYILFPSPLICCKNTHTHTHTLSLSLSLLLLLLLLLLVSVFWSSFCCYSFFVGVVVFCVSVFFIINQLSVCVGVVCFLLVIVYQHFCFFVLNISEVVGVVSLLELHISLKSSPLERMIKLLFLRHSG